MWWFPLRGETSKDGKDGLQMTTLQMIIVTGGYDGSQDVASTEVMDYSGEKILKLQFDNCF